MVGRGLDPEAHLAAIHLHDGDPDIRTDEKPLESLPAEYQHPPPPVQVRGGPALSIARPHPCVAGPERPLRVVSFVREVVVNQPCRPTRHSITLPSRRTQTA